MEAAEKIGHRLARKYYGIDADDITQEVLLAALKEWAFLSRLDDKTREAVLYKKGKVYCFKELDHAIKASGQWIYTSDVVSELLPHLFQDVSAWLETPTPDRDDTHRSGGRAVYLWDIREAFKRLNDRETDVLTYRYRDGQKLNSADRAACSRAVEKICRVLNRHFAARTDRHQGPGNRTVIGNAQAQYQTRVDIDGA
ncbi:hypothetical protein [Acrocarpospora sp. B8E8]|uniref:hypothetical protein n=1 Tax=Acrocarpospora sp. B8E8 TaxID=3153572 RepID=UPI00325D63BD